MGSSVLDDLISIPASGICTYLDDAEQNMAKQNEGATRTAKPWVRKRRRTRTPPVDDEREARF